MATYKIVELDKPDRAVTSASPGTEQVPALWLGPEAPPRRLRELLAERGLFLISAAGDSLAAQVGSYAGAILCFGPGSSPARVRDVLETLEREAPGTPCLSVVLAATAATAAAAAGTDDLGAFQDLIDDDRLFYLSRGPLSDRDLVGLLEGAAGALARRMHRQALRAAAPASPLPVDMLRQFALARTLGELAAATVAAVEQATGTERGRCLLYDPQREAVWSPGHHADGFDPADADTAGESPAVGLISFILRAGQALCLPRVGEDTRFDPDLDNPGGDPADRFLGVPVSNPEGEVVAVLSALRPAQHAPFEPREIAALEAVASQVSPYLAALAPSAVPRSSPFRERALRERDLTMTPLEPLRLTPAWTRWTWWLMMAALAAGLLALIFVRVPEYASGVAVIRAGGRTDVTATAGGTVSSLAVTPQSRVQRGQLLLRLHDAEEAANLKRLDRQLELKLVQRLQAPSDPAVAQDLVALRAEREMAAARLGERELRAPAGGEVSDVRVAPGQLLAIGQPVLSILERAELPSVIALLPGRYLPQLQPGMKVRLELPGHSYVYQWITLDSVAQEVIGPAEARRLLGAVAGDAMPLEGPLAMATAPLSSSTFEVAGRTYPFRDGMPTQAEVRVRSERLLFVLMPALKSLRKDPDV